MAVHTKKDNGRRKGGDHCPIATLFHDPVYDWDGETTEDRGKHTHSDKRNMIFGVAIANVLEIKLTIESHEPAGEPKKEFCERWVYVEVVFP